VGGGGGGSQTGASPPGRPPPGPQRFFFPPPFSCFHFLCSFPPFILLSGFGEISTKAPRPFFFFFLFSPFPPCFLFPFDALRKMFPPFHLPGGPPPVERVPPLGMGPFAPPNLAPAHETDPGSPIGPSRIFPMRQVGPLFPPEKCFCFKKKWLSRVTEAIGWPNEGW